MTKCNSLHCNISVSLSSLSVIKSGLVLGAVQ